MKVVVVASHKSAHRDLLLSAVCTSNLFEGSFKNDLRLAFCTSCIESKTADKDLHVVTASDKNMFC